MKVQADPQIARLASGDMVLDALARRKARKAAEARACHAPAPEGGYCTENAAWQIDMGTKVRTFACDQHVVTRIREYADYAASYGTTKATVKPL